MTTTDNPEFLQCCVLDGKGGAKSINHDELSKWDKSKGTLWVHLDYMDPASREWLRHFAKLPKAALEFLLAEETRPRSVATNKGLLIVLRGVNMNPGEDPEDMVAVRLWIEHDRIISTRRRRLLSVADIRQSLDAGIGPTSSGAFLTALTSRLADRIGDFVDTIEGRLEDAEDRVVSHDPAVSRQTIAMLRRQIASVRRFLAPQREALDRLNRQSGGWIVEDEVQNLLDQADRITRYVEDLDLVRERAIVLQEEYLGLMAQEQNSRMYVLSVVAAIFLPLTFITGLLGMNVGGLPGLESPIGFWVSIVIMIVAAVGLAAFFRWKRWF
ncbi:MAG TPA: zinc transporter ZntB [Woeseiaceae bacterium]